MMRWVLWAGFLLAAQWALLVCAAPLPVDVQPTSQAALSAAPRQIVSLSFRVTNRGTEGLLAARVEAPAGWRVISGTAPFALKAGETQVRFVSVYVPEVARAGEHAVSYVVTDPGHPDTPSAAQVLVRVLPATKLLLSAIEAADFVIAGEAYRTVYLLQNRGNDTIDVEFKATSTQRYPIDGGTGSLRIEPGASKRIEIGVATAATNRSERDWLTLSARVNGKAEPETATTSISVIPRVTGVEQIYDTIPATAGLAWMIRNQDGVRTSGWQGLFTGGGTLDPAGERQVSFLLRGPNASNVATYGLQQQYYANYSDRNLSLGLGDQSYGLSPLTEQGFYGRGAGAGYRSGNVAGSLYVVETVPGTTSDRREIAANASYFDVVTGRWDANFLHKQAQVIVPAQDIALQAALNLAFCNNLRNQALAPPTPAGGIGPIAGPQQSRSAPGIDAASLSARSAATLCSNLPVESAWSAGSAVAVASAGDAGLGPVVAATSAANATLSVKGDATVYSLRNQMLWRPGLNTDLEVAGSTGLGRSGQAFRAYVNHSTAPLTYNVTVLGASADYLGYYTNQRAAAGSFTYQTSPAWNANGYFNIQRNNLSGNPWTQAPDQKLAGLGLGFQLPGGGQASGMLVYRSDVDRRTNPDFDMDHQGARLAYSQQFGSLGFFATGEWGTTHDVLHQSRYGTSLYLANVYWRPTAAQSYALYTAYDNNTYSNSYQRPTSTTGFTAMFWPWARTSLGLMASRSEGPGASNIFDLRIGHELSNGHVIGVLARHSTGSTTDSEAYLTYTIPLKLPVGRKKDIATLHGRVYDAEGGSGVPDVVVRLGSLVAVSDATGNFMFPSVKLGNYALSIDRSEAASGKVPLTPMPLDLDIRQGEVDPIEIPMIRGVTLSGAVRVDEAAASQPARPSSPTGSAGASEGSTPERQTVGDLAKVDVANMLVVMRNGDKVFRRATDGEGRFRLGGLPPGRWTIGIDEGSVPTGYEPEKKQVVVTIKPGGQEEIALRLVPRLRTIRMQAPMKAIQ